MIKNLFFRIVVCIAVSTIFFSCMSEAKYVKKRARLNPAIVPKDFDPNTQILLFAEMPRLNKPEERNNVVTNKLDKALKEFCPYKYEIVSLKDISENTEKYGNMSVYKYVILNSLNSTWNTTTTTTTITDNTGTHRSSVSPSARTTTVDFYFYDRVAKENYRASGNPTSHISYTIAAFIATIKKAKGQ